MFYNAYILFPGWFLEHLVQYMSYPEIYDSTQKMAVSYPLLNLGTSTDITQLVHEERDAFLTYLYNFCIFEQKS